MPDVGEDADFARVEDSTDKMLEAMIVQMNKATASAEAAIDDALVEVDRSNHRIESM